MRDSNIEIASIKQTFDILKTELDSKGYGLISLKDYALLTQEGKIIPDKTRTKEAFIYMPNNKVYLTKNSPILASPKEATLCHKKGIEFYLNHERVDKALENAVEIKHTRFPTKEFAGYAEMKFAFGEEYAEKFGLFLYGREIKEMPAWLCDVDSMPFARQASIEYRSPANMLILSSMNLNSEIPSLGIRHKGAV